MIKKLLSLLVIPLSFVLLGINSCGPFPTKTVIYACQPLYTAGHLECFTADIFVKTILAAPLNTSPPNSGLGTVTFYDNVSRKVLGVAPVHLVESYDKIFGEATFCKVFSQNSVDVTAIYSGLSVADPASTIGNTPVNAVLFYPSKSEDVAVFKTSQPGFACDLGD